MLDGGVEIIYPVTEVFAIWLEKRVLKIAVGHSVCTTCYVIITFKSNFILGEFHNCYAISIEDKL